MTEAGDRFITRRKDEYLKSAVESIVQTLKELNSRGCCTADTRCLDGQENVNEFVECICRSFETNTIESLDRYLEPVQAQLRNLDAKRLLEPNCRNSLKIGDDVSFESGNIRPIHDLVYPQPPPMYKENKSCSYVRYLHVAENEVFSVGIFVFPPFAKIPLHDHPGMCVLSRVLYGELDVTSYDLISEKEEGNEPYMNKEKKYSYWLSNFLPSLSYGRQFIPSGSKSARKVENKSLKASDVVTLFPLRGNMHEFVAGAEGAAVLDVLMPPYDDDKRECTYFAEESNENRVIPDDMISSTHYSCLLVPIRQPSNFHCVGGDFGSFTK